MKAIKTWQLLIVVFVFITIMPVASGLVVHYLTNNVPAAVIASSTGYPAGVWFIRTLLKRNENKKNATNQDSQG